MIYRCFQLCARLHVGDFDSMPMSTNVAQRPGFAQTDCISNRIITVSGGRRPTRPFQHWGQSGLKRLGTPARSQGSGAPLPLKRRGDTRFTLADSLRCEQSSRSAQQRIARRWVVVAMWRLQRPPVLPGVRPPAGAPRWRPGCAEGSPEGMDFSPGQSLQRQRCSCSIKATRGS